MKHHTLKCDPAPFKAAEMEWKAFEIRFNDRNFQHEDTITLEETVFSGEQMKSDPLKFPLEYTGRHLFRTVTYILRGPIHGLAEGWVVMSIT